MASRRESEDVFLAAYDAVTAHLAERVGAAADAEDTFAGRCRAALRAFVEYVAAEPAAGRMWMVEALGAGPAAVARRDRTTWVRRKPAGPPRQRYKAPSGILYTGRMTPASRTPTMRPWNPRSTMR